ncbi:MAG: hypothetical protein KBT04_07400 [Bacteroidales bacterium]|nr:hypothetical protein [Candidatus Colimorpha onthohippi]
MKKLMLSMALVAVTMGAMAQTVNVQSAIQDLKKGYLNKAKPEIDQACEHESTKDDAKTWCYAGMIYSRIGGEVSNPKSKYRNLDPDWCEKAYNAAMRCKELDKNNEYADLNNSVFRFIGNEYYTRAVSAFNDEKDYTKALDYADKSIKIFNNSGDQKFANDSYYLAGLCGKALKDNEKILTYFKPLVRRKSDKNEVYRSLFDLYKGQGDTVEASKVAARYVENCPNDYNSYLMAAESHLLRGDVEGGRAMIDKALEKAQSKPELYAQLLGASAQILENIQDYEGAEAKYLESLKLNPVQFASNFGMGKMFFNRGVDKLTAANEVPLDDETGLSDKLKEEANGFYRQSIQYFKAAISYIDGLTDAEAQRMQRKNLYDCLNALKTVYARLEMYDELKPINARLTELQAQ